MSSFKTTIGGTMEKQTNSCMYVKVVNAVIDPKAKEPFFEPKDGKIHVSEKDIIVKKPRVLGVRLTRQIAKARAQLNQYQVVNRGA